MWKFLIFNSLWFLILFLVHFARSRILQLGVFGLLCVCAVWAAAATSIDPLGWLYYLVFSILVFWGARQFRRWAFARSIALDDQLEMLSRKRDAAQGVLNEREAETKDVERRAGEIEYLYDKVREMSDCLDMLEMLLVYGEALSKHLKFGVLKLALFDEDKPDVRHPTAVYGLSYSDFEGFFDRSLFLKGKKKVKTDFFPLDLEICETVLKKRESLKVLQSQTTDSEKGPWPDFRPFFAQPVFIQDKIFAVLILLGVDRAEPPALSILTEGFASEAQRVKLYEKVETLAITDGLTGMYVRRHLAERLEEEVDRGKRFGLKLSFLMIDIDHFKRFNDEYGHLVGDVVLRQVAETINSNVREIDLVGRYGGEEFGVLLVETDSAGAFYAAERIRRAVADRTFRAYDESLRVTISIGCATLTSILEDAHSLVDAADSALYQAKRQGRNKVCLSDLSSGV